MQAIQEVMPPVFSVEESPQALSTAHFPHPLNVAPLPPMIIVEKGESLDEFILRRHPDFFTTIQVRASAHCAYIAFWLECMEFSLTRRDDTGRAAHVRLHAIHTGSHHSLASEGVFVSGADLSIL